MKNKTLQILFASCLLVITLSIAYYFVIFLPGIKNQERADAISRERASQEAIQNEETKKYNQITYCQNTAATQAIELLKTKAKINPSLYGTVAKEEGMYLRLDYDSYYQQCLEKMGITP